MPEPNLASPEMDVIWNLNRRITRLDDKEAWNLLQARAAMGERGRDPVHLLLSKQWFVNIASYLGLQHSDMQDIAQDLDPAFVGESGGPTYVANHLFRIVNAQVARMSNAPPDVDVIPKTPDIDDQEGAKVGQHFLDHYEDIFNMREKRRYLSYVLSTCGTGFIRVEWNPRAGKRYRTYSNPITGETMRVNSLSDAEKQFLTKVKASKELAEGDIEVEVLMPFQVLVPHLWRDLKDIPWMVIVHQRSLEWCWNQFGNKAASITADELATTEDGQYWRRISSLVSRYGFTMPSRAGSLTDAVEIRELWIPPSDQYPKGVRIVGTKKQLLENGPHPYAEAGLDIRFPVTKFVYSDVPGRFWGSSLVEHLLGPQREYNRARSQTIQQRDILATPQWLVPDNCELTSTRNEYGDIWTYRGAGGKPELQQSPQISSFHQDTIERALLDMQTIAAQSEASQAQVPANVRSGAALRALQEKDLAVLGPTVEALEDGFKEVYERLLMMTWKFVKTEKSIRIYGEFRQADVGIFKGSDLFGNVFVRIRPGSMMPKSKAETMETVMELVQLQAIQPAMNPRHARMVFKALEIGGMDKVFLEEDLDRRRANIENQMFLRPQVDEMTGMPAPMPAVNDDDDHAAHLEEHMLFKKSDAYEMLPLMRKLQFDAHMLAHRQGIAELVQTQVAMAQASAPGGGAGSQPKELGKASQPSMKGQSSEGKGPPTP